jgi:hypothetical protein
MFLIVDVSIGWPYLSASRSTISSFSRTRFTFTPSLSLNCCESRYHVLHIACQKSPTSCLSNRGKANKRFAEGLLLRQSVATKSCSLAFLRSPSSLKKPFSTAEKIDASQVMPMYPTRTFVGLWMAGDETSFFLQPAVRRTAWSAAAIMSLKSSGKKIRSRAHAISPESSVEHPPTEEGLVNIRLLSIYPSYALRPYFQEAIWPERQTRHRTFKRRRSSNSPAVVVHFRKAPVT